MSYNSIDLSENPQNNRYPITNDFGLLYNYANPSATGNLSRPDNVFRLNDLGNRARSILPQPQNNSNPLGVFDLGRALEPYRPDPNSCQREDDDPKKRQCIPKSNPPVLGRSHYKVRDFNIGGEAHHMPSFGVIEDSGIALKYDTAPAICMRIEDHALTDSSRVRANDEQADAIRRFGAFGFEIVQGRDILEVRGKFGTRYDFGINQMRNYTRQLITTRPELFQQC
jgi:hypothetical protein